MALLEQAMRKNFIALLDKQPQCRMVRMQGLNQYLARSFSASSASRDLQNDLRRVFRCAEIGTHKPSVGTKNADECDVRKVVPLGEHLCTDKDRRATGWNLQQLRSYLPAAHRIAVDAHHRYVREAGREEFLNPLCTNAERYEVAA